MCTEYCRNLFFHEVPDDLKFKFWHAHTHGHVCLCVRERGERERESMNELINLM
jgi:hypothetical protein